MRPVQKGDNLLPSCATVMKSGNLNFLQPCGPLQACNGLLYHCSTHVMLIMSASDSYFCYICCPISCVSFCIPICIMHNSMHSLYTHPFTSVYSLISPLPLHTTAVTLTLLSFFSAMTCCSPTASHNSHVLHLILPLASNFKYIFSNFSLLD